MIYFCNTVPGQKQHCCSTETVLLVLFHWFCPGSVVDFFSKSRIDFKVLLRVVAVKKYSQMAWKYHIFVDFVVDVVVVTVLFVAVVKFL